MNKKLAALLLKYFSCAKCAIDEFLEELQYLLSTASLRSTTNVIKDTLSSYSLQADQSVIKELASTLCTSSPVHKSIVKCCPLATVTVLL